jgi:hypothetical protein
LSTTPSRLSTSAVDTADPDLLRRRKTRVVTRIAATAVSIVSRARPPPCRHLSAQPGAAQLAIAASSRAEATRGRTRDQRAAAPRGRKPRETKTRGTRPRSADARAGLRSTPELGRRSRSPPLPPPSLSGAELCRGS